jgi:hypothetical protein
MKIGLPKMGTTGVQHLNGPETTKQNFSSSFRYFAHMWLRYDQAIWSTQFVVLQSVVMVVVNLVSALLDIGVDLALMAMEHSIITSPLVVDMANASSTRGCQ